MCLYICKCTYSTVCHSPIVNIQLTHVLCIACRASLHEERHVHTPHSIYKNSFLAQTFGIHFASFIYDSTGMHLHCEYEVDVPFTEALSLPVLQCPGKQGGPCMNVLLLARTSHWQLHISSLSVHKRAQVG